MDKLNLRGIKVHMEQKQFFFAALFIVVSIVLGIEPMDSCTRCIGDFAITDRML